MFVIKGNRSPGWCARCDTSTTDFLKSSAEFWVICYNPVCLSRTSACKALTKCKSLEMGGERRNKGSEAVFGWEKKRFLPTV